MVMRQRRIARRGFALIDAILGGLLLAFGLAAVVTLSQRSLVMLQRGEREAQASALLDELLGQVVAEGPVDFSRRRPVAGKFDAPWSEWSFAIDLSSNGEGDAWDVGESARHQRCRTSLRHQGGGAKCKRYAGAQAARTHRSQRSL